MKKLISKFKTANKKKIIIISIIVLAVAAGGIFTYSKLGKKTTATAANFTSSRVERGDISVTISGSGTIEPISRYEIVALVQGDILSCDYEEGDAVKEGAVLYRIDSDDIQNNIQSKRNNVEKAQLSAKTNNEKAAKTLVRAPASGTLTDFNLKVNDTAKTDTVAYIVDNDTMIATIKFNANQISKIKVGDSATITSALYMTTIDGKVSYISNASSGSSDGSNLYEVEIKLQNPGSLVSGTSVGATIHTSEGDVKSPVSGSINNADTIKVIPEVSGKITAVYVKNNQRVNKGDLLFKIDDTDYVEAQRKSNIELQDAMLQLENANKELEKYNITSPIDGVVLSKTYKAGDTIGNNSSSSSSSGTSTGKSSSNVLMTVADISKMVFNLDVDELEISKIQVGHMADITADALPNEKFSGRVTKVSKEGTSSNGVTTYKVELTIDEPGNLISGMNVNAEIIVEQSKDTLILPVSAVSNVKNGKGTVLVKADSAGNDKELPREKGREGGPGNQPGGNSQRQPGGNSDGQQGGVPPQGMTDEQRQQMAQRANAGNQNGKGLRGGFGSFGVPDGYKRVIVTVGLSNTDNIEILSGLNEGDEVFISSARASSSSTRPNGGMPRQMGGGGMGGGMGGPPMR